MRIVIIGEFSSFSKNLSEGFRVIGHDCFVFSWGDGKKKITQEQACSYTIDARYYGTNIFQHLLFLYKSYIEFLRLKRRVNQLSKEKKFDVALIINSSFIKERGKFWQALFTKGMIFQLINNKNNIYLSACGGDVPYYEYWSKHDWKNKVIMSEFKKYESRQFIRHHKYVMSFINKVIPVMYDYAEAWRNAVSAHGCAILKTIPLPVNCINYKRQNEIRDKIVIFHGITRPKIKGSQYIIEAMKRIEEKYPDLVECRAEGGLPLSEYLPLINRTNILIDQTCAGSVGMNGVYGLAMGKVVLGGNELHNQEEYNEYDCPIINIGPDVNEIYEKIEVLISHPEEITRLADKSRDYAERVHDATIVAKSYIHLFSRDFAD